MKPVLVKSGRFFRGNFIMTQGAENKELNVETLKKRSDFLRVAATRKKWVSPMMIIQMSTDQNKNTRVGYTASKKVGNAVIRNKAKRRLREVVKQVMNRTVKAGHDYVIIARNGIESYPFKELIRDMKWSLKRLHEDAHKRQQSNNDDNGGIIS